MPRAARIAIIYPAEPQNKECPKVTRPPYPVKRFILATNMLIMSIEIIRLRIYPAIKCGNRTKPIPIKIQMISHRLFVSIPIEISVLSAK
jgi:hypothetical protein